MIINLSYIIGNTKDFMHHQDGKDIYHNVYSKHIERAQHRFLKRQDHHFPYCNREFA